MRRVELALPRVRMLGSSAGAPVPARVWKIVGEFPSIASMKETEMTVEQGFYQAYAELLGVNHAYRRFPYAKPTRWNNRAAGNGRYPGVGLVRLFGKSVHVQLRAPHNVNRWFSSREEALSFLAGLNPRPLKRAA
jgi:hypothetical protein